MLTHCDFVYAGQSAKFQLPFINLALVPEQMPGMSWTKAGLNLARRTSGLASGRAALEARRAMLSF